MKNFSPGFWPTVMTIPIVIVLLTLSIWQLNRYAWKVELIDHLSAQLALDPVDLPTGDVALSEWEHRKVRLRGEFLHEKEIHLFSHADKGRKGFQIITPFKRAETGQIYLVNRGWVNEGFKDPENRTEGLLSGVVKVTGVVRKPWTKSYDFLPDNNRSTNVWLYGDLAQMAAHQNVEAAPFFIELDATPVPGGWPIGGQTRISIPNNHLEYFITWLGLAAAMLAIYIFYGIGKAKKKD
ncbi:MAG: surfeit locus 1 family protein [Sneathiella sp.]|jgi:surfeit locus 1 family protein